MQNRKNIVSLILTLGLMIISTFVFIGCSNVDEDGNKYEFEIMLLSGNGYNVTSNQIVRAKRGQSVEFSVDIDDGFALYKSSVGEFKDNKLTINDVQHSLTVIFDVRKLACVDIHSENAKVEIISNNPENGGTNLFIGEKAKINFIADNNYNIESLYINSEAVELKKQDYHNATAEVVLVETMHIEANVLGDEYDFEVQNDNTRGSYEIVSSTIINGTPRYGDRITILAVPSADQYTFGYFDFNGKKIFDNKPLTVEIKEKTLIKVQFYNKFENKIIYNPNGGKFVGEPIHELRYTVGNFENLDHCYNKMEREGYSLIGLQEGIDGEIHSLGGMVKIPEIDLEVFAVWKKWTDANNFIFSLNANGKYIIKGLSAVGINANLQEIVIPEKYNNKDVVEVGYSAFQGNTKIQSVYFTKNIINIEDSAFKDCLNLEKVMIFETLNSKAENAFDNCPRFTTCEINATSDVDNHNGYDSYTAMVWNVLRENNRGKKLITIAGSSGAFGLNDGIVMNELSGYELLNFGFQRGIGIRFILSIVSPFVQNDDIVILSPEYYDFTYGAVDGWAGYGYGIVQKNYDIMRYVNIKDSPDLFLNITTQFDYKAPGGIFAPVYKNGNNTFMLNDNGVFFEEMGNEFSPYVVDEISLDLIQRTNIDIILKYNSIITNKGAKLYFSFPPYAKQSLYGNSLALDFRNSFQEKLKKELSSDNEEIVPVISNLENYLLDVKYFYNTHYHLNTEGARIRTELLINDIKAQLAKEGEVA